MKNDTSNQNTGAVEGDGENQTSKRLRFGSVHSKEVIPPGECCGSAHSSPVGGGVTSTVHTGTKSGDE